MTRAIQIACAVLLGAFLCSVAAAAPDTDRYIIKYQNGKADQVRAALKARGAEIARELPSHDAMAARMPASAASGIERNPNVEYVEVDQKRYMVSHLDGAQEQPYGIAMVQADQVSDAAANNRTICIIDSGYDSAHPDLSGNNVTGSSDPGGAGLWYDDGSHHGTHVGGTISALSNGIGVVGVLGSGNVKLHIVKVFGNDGTWAYSSDLVAALDVCQSNGANVVSMSLGGTFKSRFEDVAFAQAYNAGVLSIAAAGNDGNTRKSYPASYDSVVSVAAIDSNKMIADFSQQNSAVELAAPGVNVLSTVPVGTGTESTVDVSGTGYDSNAMEDSPIASGTGALVDCGLGDSVCTGAAGAVCLIQRGTITFADKVLNCQNGGGTAAIIYNNVSGALLGTLGGVATAIPSVGVSQADGQAMLGQLGQGATVTVATSNYAYFDGTSMATPHTSGVATLVWSTHPECTNAEIRAILDSTAEDLGAAGRDPAYGYGLVQARAAVDYIDANGCTAPGGGGGGGGGGGSCDLGQKGDSCSSNADCCSNSCKGKPGAKTCK